MSFNSSQNRHGISETNFRHCALNVASPSLMCMNIWSLAGGAAGGGCGSP